MPCLIPGLLGVLSILIELKFHKANIGEYLARRYCKKLKMIVRKAHTKHVA